MLEVNSVTVRFGSLTAVDRVSFSVQEGELKAIIGPNGAGKTTLFNVLSGHARPDGGSIRFQGDDVTGLKPHERSRRGIARSFQITNFFPNLTVLENVRIAAQSRDPRRSSALLPADRLEATREQALQVLAEVGLAGEGERLAKHLSYGDQRHLEIAIALATDPLLLLLDEPTSGMSPAETERTIELIRRLRRERTIVLIEHDMDVVMSVSDSVMVMSHGRKIAEGTPDEISNDRTVQEVYLGGAPA